MTWWLFHTSDNVESAFTHWPSTNDVARSRRHAGTWRAKLRRLAGPAKPVLLCNYSLHLHLCDRTTVRADIA